MSNITNEDLQMIDKLNEIMQKGYYADGRQVTDLYNRVINPATPLVSTNCSACIRRRISDLVNFKNKMERKLELENKAVSEASETLKQEEPTTVKAEENKPVREAKNKKVKK